MIQVLLVPVRARLRHLYQRTLRCQSIDPVEGVQCMWSRVPHKGHEARTGDKWRP